MWQKLGSRPLPHININPGRARKGLLKMFEKRKKPSWGIMGDSSKPGIRTGANNAETYIGRGVSNHPDEALGRIF